jgi:hypothetical protein
MDSVMTSTATVVIDGDGPYECEVEITQRVEMVRSWGATKPDPRWEHTDSHGHFHTFAEDGSLPTLRTEIVEMPCDGSCDDVCGGEGYTITRYRCKICGDEVEPGYVPDYQARESGTPIMGPKDATVTIHSDRVFEERTVSVHVTANGDEWIGIGEIHNTGATWSGGEAPTHTAEVFAQFLEPRLS